VNKTAIKNFAIWARNKLIADIKYKAGLLGITEKIIKSPLPQSTNDVQFFDIGTKEPYSISGIEMGQRDKLAAAINNKAQQSDYPTAYQAVIEEVTYTWFNRLIAVRFMEVNDYLPSRIRVLSSESAGKNEPDLVTNPFDTDLDFTPYEKDRIVQLKNDNQLDELFRMLFIKQCNALNTILPNLFEKTCDYTELLLNVAFTDKDGVVYHLVHDIHEDDFNVSKEGQVEIIGWLYQYYNTEPKDEVFALLKKNVKITKERIPAATQLFTPDWIVRYMVENSLGRLWLEGHPNDTLQSEWKYYLDEAEQEADVQKQLDVIREEYKTIKPEDIKVIDPCMGSGHILVYAFDVLMQIYESAGYSQRDAAKSIVENNIYGLDIDNRAYQLAYFAIMMKGRQYNRRILNGEIKPHVYAIQETNGINREQLQYFGAGMDEMQRKIAMLQMQELLDTFIDAKEYGSILNVDSYEWELLCQFVDKLDMTGQLSFDAIGVEETQTQLGLLVEIGAVMAQKHDVVVTNPPYMGIGNGNVKLNGFIKKYYPDSKADLFAVFIEKCGQMVKVNHYQALITQHSWMFLSSFEKLRAKLQMVHTVNMAHLGARAFEEIGGEVVQTTAFAMRKTHIPNYKGVYVRLVEPTTQQGKEDMFLSNSNRFATAQDNFSKIPGMPISYWGNKNVFDLFHNNINLGEIAEPKSGLSSTDNDRFLRFWYEVNFDNLDFKCARVEQTVNNVCKWFCLNKGGDYRKWYGNRWYVVNWENNGYEIKETTKGAAGGRIVNTEYYFKESISCGAITSGENSFRFYPEGAIFDTNFRSLFFKKEDKYYYLGLLNSRVIEYIGQMLCSTIKLNANDISRLPVVTGDDVKNIVESLVLQCIDISRNDWNSCEISWEFAKHPLLCNENSIKSAFEYWDNYTLVQFNKLNFNEEEINRIFINLYGLEDELKAEIAHEKVTVCKADLSRDIRSFISYAVGCMFGRYSLDVEGLVYAGCQWDDSKYSTFIPDKDNILLITDEEYFRDDIVSLFVTFVKKVYGVETLEENLDFIAKALGNKGNTSREIIRNYFVKDFFKDHCKIYQKRPIYWLFDSGKADGFKALIYMHRYDENTIGNLRIDYLHQMQRIYDREIARMQETINNSTNAREVATAEKRKEKLTKQLKETKDYDEKIAHLALARTAIGLDDGVKVNYEKVQTGTDGKKLEVLAKI
jgi:type II restriction/modification system DNA methylase subunit YeeA